MKALHWDGNRLALIECDQPQPGAGEALERVAVAGVCNTDLEIVRGYMGFLGVPGHEISGTVAEGPDTWRGARVVAEINFACGHCDFCNRGLGRHCPTRRVMGILDADGGFAEYVAVPIENLHRLPDAIADEDSVFVEPLAAAFEILEQVNIEPEMRCTVLGDGKLGLLVAQVLATTGASVTAVGKHPDKLAILQAREIETVLLDDWRRQPTDVVVEATGTATGLTAAIQATRPRGTLVLKTTVAEQPEIDLAPIVINEISVVGSRCGLFAPAIEALRSGQIDVASLIAERKPLAQGVEAFESAAKPGILKVLIDVASV